MTRAAAYLFAVHEPTLLKWCWMAFTLVNVALMLWLAIRTGPLGMRMYMLAVAASSLLHSSPLWRTPYDFVLVLTACLFGWSLLSDATSRLFSASTGTMLIGVVMGAGLADWPGYDWMRYRVRMYAAVGLLAVSVASVMDRWARGEKKDWRVLIACAWFAVWFLSLVQWRTDTETAAYWREYWQIALAAKAGWTMCLVSWIVATAKRGESKWNGT